MNLHYFQAKTSPSFIPLHTISVLSSPILSISLYSPVGDYSIYRDARYSMQVMNKMNADYWRST